MSRVDMDDGQFCCLFCILAHSFFLTEHMEHFLIKESTFDIYGVGHVLLDLQWSQENQFLEIRFTYSPFHKTLPKSNLRMHWIPGWPFFYLHRWRGGGLLWPRLVSREIMHIQGCVQMFEDQLFEPNQMDLRPSDFYKGFTQDSMLHVFELVMTNHQPYRQI